jgi:hypothetical protein
MTRGGPFLQAQGWMLPPSAGLFPSGLGPRARRCRRPQLPHLRWHPPQPFPKQSALGQRRLRYRWDWGCCDRGACPLLVPFAEVFGLLRAHLAGQPIWTPCEWRTVCVPDVIEVTRLIDEPDVIAGLIPWLGALRGSGNNVKLVEFEGLRAAAFTSFKSCWFCQSELSVRPGAG